jgi:hypothetical protein
MSADGIMRQADPTYHSAFSKTTTMSVKESPAGAALTALAAASAKTPNRRVLNGMIGNAKMNREIWKQVRSVIL